MKRNSVIAVAWLLMFLAGCGAPPSKMNFTLTPQVGGIPAAERLYPNAALLITPTTRDYVWEGHSENMYGSATVKHFPLGTALEDAAIQAYSQIFENVRIIQNASQAKETDIVIELAIRGHRIYGHGKSLLGPYAATVRITTHFKVSGRGKTFMDRSFQSPLLRTPFYSSNETMRTETQQVVSKAVALVAKDSVEKLLGSRGFMTMAAARKAPPAAVKESAPKVVETAKSTQAASLSNREAPASKGRFPTESLAVSFPKAPPSPDDIAVIIGNADYSNLGRDIPDVVPAYADAAGIKVYVTQALGVREGNIIDLSDATGAKLVEVFGSRDNPRGQLFDWVKPGLSRVFVYYAGHGAPAGSDGSALLVPADANSARIELSGYPLATLYGNLGQIPARSITVVLEACFSGASQSGTVVSHASPVYLKAKATDIPANVTVISAGAANQIASWEQDKSHGLFTKFFLKGMSGEADAAPHGNGDGKVALVELDRYLKETLTYYARRYYGRDQTARIVVAKSE